MQKKIKNILILLSILLLLIGNVSAAAYSQINLIDNFGFELGTPGAWTTTPNDGNGGITSVAVQSGIKQSGSYSMEYYLNSQTSGVKYAAISQPVNFDSAGNTLTFYTYDHASGGTGYTYYSVYIDGIWNSRITLF